MGRGADDRIMQIVWSNEDNAYVITVPALPGCVTHGDTYEEAQRRGQEAIESWIEASKAWGDPIPDVVSPQDVRESDYDTAWAAYKRIEPRYSYANRMLANMERRTGHDTTVSYEIHITQ